MSITRTSATFKLREDLVDQITPKALANKEVTASLGHFKPAPWLPVEFTKSNYQAGEDAFVISAFKPVALAGLDAHVVPAGLKLAMGGTGSAAGAFAGTVLTYTSTDVTWGVTDLVTGEAVTAAVTYTGEQVCDALITRGLVRDDDAIAAGGAIPVTTDAHVAVVIDLFISDCVGFVLQDVNVWSGLPEDGDQVYTNYSKQHGVTFWTKAQLRVPHRVAGEDTADTFVVATLDGLGSTAYAAGTFIDDGEYWNVTNVRQLTRYSYLTATAPVVALGLAERPVARNTDRTPVACDRDGVLVRERTSADLVTREGDWYLDADVGVLFLHTDTWATLVALGAVNTNFSYSFYTDTGLASSPRFIHFDGPCRPGDWVYYDAESNFVTATAAQKAAASAVGRVHKIIVEPRDLLQHVKTGWNLSNASSSMKMPGTATKGYSDLITLSSETVADQLVEIKFEV